VLNAGKLLSLDRGLEPCLAPILWLLDAPVEDLEWERLDPHSSQKLAIGDVVAPAARTLHRSRLRAAVVLGSPSTNRPRCVRL
jgi:hypothetical protein